MRHRIDDVIDAETIGERSQRLGIDGVVGVLPGIAEVHVEVDRDHEPASVVEDAEPVRRKVALESSRMNLW